MRNKFNKYRYLGNVYPEVSKPWIPAIYKMIIKLDKEVRPWGVPLWFLNGLTDLKNLNDAFSMTYSNIIEFFIGNINIFTIKVKFAGLRVYGTFTDSQRIIVKKAITECASICEQCGSTENVKETIANNWVINLCETCKK